MEKTVGTEVAVGTRAHVEPARQAYHILHWGFVAAPTIAGIDKFTHLLTNWDQYLAPSVEKMLPMSGHAFMLLVGVVEIIAGLIVLAGLTRIGGYIVMIWLIAIAINLVTTGMFYDLAVRDIEISLAAFTLTRLERNPA